MGQHGNHSADTDPQREAAGCDGITRDLQARKNTTALVRRAREVGQVNIAAYAGVSDSLVNRWFAENADAMGRALAFMGLKCVSVRKQCYDPDEVEAIFRLAQRRMNSMRSAEDLNFDDDVE